jgi:hypothetical protein
MSFTQVIVEPSFGLSWNRKRAFYRVDVTVDKMSSWSNDVAPRACTIKLIVDVS